MGFFIEPLSSSTKTKSTGVAQGGSDDGGGGGGEGDGGDGGDGGGKEDDGGGGKQISHPANVTLASVTHLIGVPSGTTLSGELVPQERTPFTVR